MGESDWEAVSNSTRESLETRLSQGTPAELRQRLDETSIESAAEGTPPGLGQAQRRQSGKVTTCLHSLAQLPHGPPEPQALG